MMALPWKSSLRLFIKWAMDSDGTMSVSGMYGGYQVLTSAASNNVSWTHGLRCCLLRLVLISEPRMVGHIVFAAECKCNVSSSQTKSIVFMPWGIRNNSNLI